MPVRSRRCLSPASTAPLAADPHRFGPRRHSRPLAVQRLRLCWDGSTRLPPAPPPTCRLLTLAPSCAAGSHARFFPWSSLFALSQRLLRSSTAPRRAAAHDGLRATTHNASLQASCLCSPSLPDPPSFSRPEPGTANPTSRVPSVRCRRRKGARLRCTPQPLGRELYLSLPFSQAQPLCARRLSPRTPRTHVAVPPASARSLPRCAPHTHLLSAVSTRCAGALSVASRSTSRRRVHNGAVLRRPGRSGLGLPGPAERSRDQARKYY